MVLYSGEGRNVPGAAGNLFPGNVINAPGPKPFPLPLAYNQFPGTPPMGNAGFFAGPQMGQMPAGFQNKIVS